MSDTKHEVAVEFKAKDLTSAVIGRINKSAGVLGKTVDNITRKVAGFSALGGLAAVFGFGASVHSAKKYLGTIEMLSTITGQAANNTAGMFHAMEQSGLSAEDTKAVMISMARKQADIVGGSKELAKMAKKYGVELTKGPDKALISMAKSVKEGKIGTGEVVKLLEESGSKAMDLLRKGPVEVQRLLAEGAKKNSHINATSIAQYKQMDIQMTRVKQSWTRVTSIIMIKLAPSLTKLMQYVERNIDSWTDGAGRFGEFLVNHMTTALTTARIMGKVLMANYVLMKLTGEGLVANSGKLLSMAKGKKAGAVAAAGGGGAADAAMTAAMLAPRGGKGGRVSGRKGVMAKRKGPKVGKVMSKMLGRFPKMGLNLLLIFKRIGGIGGKFGKTFGRVGKIVAKVGKVFARIAVSVGPLMKVASMLLRLTVIGVVITAVVAGIKQILSNVDGIRDRLGSLLGKTWESIKGIAKSLGNMFGADSAVGKFFAFVGKAFVGVLEAVLWLVSKIMRGIEIAAMMADKKVTHDVAINFIHLRRDKERMKSFEKGAAIQLKLQKAHEAGEKTTAKHVAMVKEMNAAFAESKMRGFTGGIKGARQINKAFMERFGKVAETPDGRPQVHNDFRGSRFDIQQNFAEGFDPDRIAVAFSSDLASLGERRLQSGLAPAFSAR